MASTLGTSTVHSLELRYPPFGDWRADLVLEAGEAPAVGSRTVLTVGDLVLQCTVLRSGLDAPDRPHVVVSGAPGWARLIARPLSYQSDAGVRLSTVLQDLSEAAGQEVEQPTDGPVGEHYEVIAARDGDPARYRDALDELAEEGLLEPWRVDPDGVTRFGARAGTEVTARATVLRKGAGVGRAVYGIDAPLAFLPGNTISGVPISFLVVTETNGRLEAEIYTEPPSAAPSIKASVQRMVWRYLQDFVRTYVVAEVLNDGRVHLFPPADSPHLPEMKFVPVWTIGGIRTVPPAGSEVLVVFRDRRRTRPVVIAFAPVRPTDMLMDADEFMYVGPNADGIVIRQGTFPAGRGGATIELTGAAGAGELKVTTPSGTVRRWTIGATGFTVTPVPPNTGAATIDEGTAEVLV